MKKHPMKAWNKGELVGKKTALTREQIQTIKQVLSEAGSHRDRAMFALAIDSSLRGIDLVKLRVSDVMVGNDILEIIRLRPSKTKDSSGAVIEFEPLPYTRQLLRELIEQEDKLPPDYLFQRSKKLRGPGTSPPLSTRAYANLVKKWVSYAGLNPKQYGTHSLRRSRPAYLYMKTRNLRACQLILGHNSIQTTQEYLGVELSETLELSRQFPL